MVTFFFIGQSASELIYPVYTPCDRIGGLDNSTDDGLSQATGGLSSTYTRAPASHDSSHVISYC